MHFFQKNAIETVYYKSDNICFLVVKSFFVKLNIIAFIFCTPDRIRTDTVLSDQRIFLLLYVTIADLKSL